MINKNTSIICQCLSDSKIPHIVGGSSLLGLTTGVLTKYTNNISLYIFNYNQYKIFFLFFRLLKNGTLLKPKFKLGHLRFKLRKKNSIFEKNLEYCTLFPGKIENNNYKFFIGGRYIYFNTDDLNENNISKIKINYLGYPGTMGTKKYDYIIADKKRSHSCKPCKFCNLRNDRFSRDFSRCKGLFAGH